MDNRFAFGVWIFLDLAVIALGAGAFFTGFLLYILRKTELKAVINSAVVLGFICYSGAVVVLMVDVGQPLRAWFTFWHPNVHSMLTEVTFCITCYLMVLAIEYAPIILRNRKLKQVAPLLVFEFELHKVVVVFAAVGTFLSFFHQGSLGGLYGVLQDAPSPTVKASPSGRRHSSSSFFPPPPRAEFHHSDHPARGEDLAEEACQDRSVRDARTHLGLAAALLRPAQVH